MSKARDDRPLAEIEIERSVTRFALFHRWQTERCVRVGRAGFPDHMFLREGIVFFIEFKKDDVEVAEPHQEIRIKDLRQNGFDCFVVGSVLRGRAVIDQMNEKYFPNA